jgi:hypothetical protein
MQTPWQHSLIDMLLRQPNKMATLFQQLTSELVRMWFLTLKSLSFFGPKPCCSKISRGTCTWTIISKNTKQATLSYNGTNLVGKSAIEKYTRIGMIDQTERHVTMMAVVRWRSQNAICRSVIDSNEFITFLHSMHRYRSIL